MPMNFLKARRDQLKLTRRQVAARGGFTETSCGNWEVGRSVPVPALFHQIAKAYDLPAETVAVEVMKLARGQLRRGPRERATA